MNDSMMSDFSIDMNVFERWCQIIYGLFDSITRNTNKKTISIYDRNRLFLH